MKSAEKKFRLLTIVVMSIMLAVFSCEFTSSTVSAEEKITISAFDYPPYMDESRPEKGLFCELAYEAYKAVGYEASFKFYPLKRSTMYVMEGRELAQLGTEWNFPEESRKKDIHALPMFYYRVVGFYLKDRFREIKFKTLKDLRGYSIGVIRGSSDSAILMKDKELKVEEVNRMEQLFKKLYANRNDIVTTVELSGLAYLSENYPNEKDRCAMTEDAVQGLIGQIVFSNKYPNSQKYTDAFKEGLSLIRENGNYMKVFEKYYGAGKVPKVVSDIEKEVYVIPKE